MAPVPGYDTFLALNGEHVTSKDMAMLVGEAYVVAGAFVLQLALVAYNTWAFLIRQKKYQTWPLAIFYALTIWLTLRRICFAIFFFELDN